MPNGKIASGQAFWVQAVAEGIPALTITEKAKRAEQPEAVMPDESSVSYLRLFLNGPDIKDGAVIAITSYGTDGFDPSFDGYKRANTGLFNFSSLTSDGVAVAINNAGDEFCAKQVRLNVQDIATGTYSISVESLQTLAGVESVKLVDHFTNVTTDLGVTPSYTFQVTADPLSFGSTRFELVLSRSEIELTVNAEANVVCGAPIEVKLTNTQAGVTYTLYNDNEVSLATFPDATGEDITFVLQPGDVIDGENHLVVKASLPGCSSAEIPQNVSFTFYRKPIVTASGITVCSGSIASVTASSNSSLSTFEWYRDETLIAGITGPSLVTDAIVEERYYSVLAVQPDGCKGDPVFVTITPVDLEDIEIFQQDDSLYTNVSALHYEWFKNGIPLAGLDKAYHFTEGSGTYTVTASAGECSRTSEGFVVTGVGETPEKILCQVFPNPTHGDDLFLKVVSTRLDDIHVAVTDMIGKPVFMRKYSLPDWKDVIRISSDKTFPAGVYFVIVEQHSMRKVIKVVVE
jgi:hypothetical protein